MARPRTPNNVIALSTSFAHNKGRYEDRVKNTPTDTRDIGEPFEEGVISIAEAWKIVVDQCPPGVLAARDRILVNKAAVLTMDTHNFEVCCRLEGKFPSAFPFYMKAARELSLLMSKLGCSPTDASRVAPTPKPAAGNAFDDD
jgi:hypothetical protein